MRESGKNYQINCNYKFELESLEDNLDDKEEDIRNKIEDVKGQVYEIRAYHESLLTKIDEQKDSICKDAGSSFSVEIEPIKSKYAQNQSEIEGIKDEINFIKTEFQNLREKIIQNARGIERKVMEEVNIQTQFEMKGLIEGINDNEEMIDEIKQKVEQGNMLSRTMKSKFDRTKVQLDQAERILTESDLKMQELIQSQVEEISKLKLEKENLERSMVDKIEDIEEEKLIISQQLDEYEQEYQRLDIENKACMKLLDEHLENGIGRIKKLDDAIRGYQKEIEILKMKNKQVAEKLKLGLNLVLEQNLPAE